MAARYWVGGGSSTAWNATGNTNWGTASNTQDNASVPGSTDDVFFDGVGTGNSASNLTASITIQSLNMTGYANTLTHDASVALTIGGTTQVCTFASGMTYTLGSATTSELKFTATSGTVTLTTAGKTIGNLTKSGTGGTLLLGDNLAMGSTSTLTLTSGTFNANNKNITVGRFNSSNTNTRVITMGSGTWSITDSGGTVWNCNTVTTGLTINANTSTIDLTYSGSTGTRSFASGRPVNNIKISAGSDTFSFSNSSINPVDLDFTGFAGTWSLAGAFTLQIFGHLTVSSGMTTSGTGHNISLLGTSKNITTNGVSITCSVMMTSGSRTMTGACVFPAFALNGGTFTTNDNALTVSQMTLKAGTFVMGASLITCSGNWLHRNSIGGSSPSESHGSTLTPGTSIVKMTGASPTFSVYGPDTYYDIWFTGSPTINTDTSNNTITCHDFKATGTPSTITFPNSTIVVTTFTVSGTVGNNITLQRTGGSGSFTLSKSSGYVSCDYLTISNSTATGGALWFAGANSTNSGGNTGWIFTAPTTPTVTSSAASSVTSTTATANGNITSTGGGNDDKRGVIYDTSSHADPGNVVPGSSGYASSVEETGSFGTGAFSENLSSLTPSTTYYYRMYAHNAVGYDYSDTEQSFTTSASGGATRKIKGHGISR